jgi:uncharacterized protein (UPF0548 family)
VSLTYPEIGATLGELPSDYHHVRESAVIGTGSAAFGRASDLVMTFEVQRRSGLVVRADASRAAVGVAVSSGIGVGRLRLWAPCRVVAVVEEPRRCGFVYGTLKGHPEIGEEAFLVVHREDDRVELQVVAFSRPANRFLALAGPASRRLQGWVTGKYLRALL